MGEEIERRLDWSAILRSVAIVVAVTTAYALIVPIIGALLVREVIPLPHDWDVLKISGHEIYRALYWVLAWGLIVWRGAAMIREVHERIIDDILVASALIAVIMLAVKFIVWIFYEPINSDGMRLFPITAFDVGGALLLFVAALIAARINRY